MNLLLLFERDFVAANRVRVRRSDIAGDEITVGVANGRIGTGRVIARDGDETELEIALDRDPPPPLPLTLVLALPRPKVLNRAVAAAVSMGIKRIFLINSWRVEKSYWGSPKLQHLDAQVVAGLEQSRDCVLPQIEVKRLFRPFVEKELPAIAANTRALVGHPAALTECPRDLRDPVTLAIGPEGGFIDAEIASFVATGFTPVSMGPRILRVETALAALVARLVS